MTIFGYVTLLILFFCLSSISSTNNNDNDGLSAGILIISILSSIYITTFYLCYGTFEHTLDYVWLLINIGMISLPIIYIIYELVAEFKKAKNRRKYGIKKKNI